MTEGITIQVIKDAVEAEQQRQGGPRSDWFIWDVSPAGFGLRFKGKAATWLLQYRNKAGETRRFKIGRYPALKPKKARELAEKVNGLVAAGLDPSGERREARKAHREAPTMSEFFTEDYLPKHSKATKAPRSYAEDLRNWASHLEPTFGKAKVKDVSGAMVLKWYLGAKQEAGTTANRCLALLRHAMNFAEGLEYRPRNSNPCVSVTDTIKFKEIPRERYLTAEEFDRAGTAIRNYFATAEASLKKTDGDKRAVRSAVAGIFLLIFTGCRLSEILKLKWAEVNRERGVLVLPAGRHKGKRRTKEIPLNSAALAVLDKLEEDKVEGCDWVLRGRKARGGLTDLEKPWQRIRKAAGIEDVRPHDLRHSFASATVNSGESLAFLQKLLGHRDIRTTMRYAHIQAEPLKQTSERVSGLITAALAPKEPVTVEG